MGSLGGIGGFFPKRMKPPFDVFTLQDSLMNFAGLLLALLFAAGVVICLGVHIVIGWMSRDRRP